jgi:hypothetical protein
MAPYVKVRLFQNALLCTTSLLEHHGLVLQKVSRLRMYAPIIGSCGANKHKPLLHGVATWVIEVSCDMIQMIQKL